MSANRTTTDPAANSNSLDDIFGSSPPQERPHTESSNAQQLSNPAEPSDLPSLRRQHVTAGYRDGISTSKGQHVQRGFDAGFSVGAQLGMRAGTILGVLEGIARGLEDRSGSGVVKKPVRGAGAGTGLSSPRGEGHTVDGDDSRRILREEVRKIYADAVKALDVRAVFAGFEAGQKGRESEAAEVLLGRKGEVVVAEWERKVSVPRWEENMEALEMKEKGPEKGDEDLGEGADGERS